MHSAHPHQHLRRPASLHSRARHSAFTLMEVMIAVTIFAITLAALFVTFRTGVKTWEIGHSTSEMFQAARVTQDMMLRDLHNVFYRPSDEYNRTFQSQVGQIANMQRLQGESARLSRRERAELLAEAGEQGFDPKNLTTPVDLAFRGEDSSATDSISFVRTQRAWNHDDRSWGLQRIKYYVRDGTLYREESSPFGVPGGTSLEDYVLDQAEAQDRTVSILSGAPPPSAVFEEEVPVGGILNYQLPDIPSTPEPLIRGVEIFNVTYGYFKSNQWNEVDTWDSSSFQYRFPEEEQEEFGPSVLSPGSNPAFQPNAMGPANETNFTPIVGRRQLLAMIDEKPVAYTVHPDDLPGYVAVQVAVRDPDKGGRLMSFTFFVSLASAQEEFDMSQIDLSALPGGGGRRR